MPNIKTITYDTESLCYTHRVDVSKLTREEQADLIIERLTNGAGRDSLEDATSYTISKLISDEIDAEILRTIKDKN